MITKTKQSLPWHIDKDEEDYNQNNKLVTPVMGAVFYGFKHDNTFDGGLLQLVDADIYDDPLQFESVRKHEVVEIKPNFNRMIIFNATKWHIDKDEEDYNQNNKLVTPVMGAVFYGFKHDNTFDGGLLQLVDADIYDDPLQFESVRKHEVVEIKPNFNRMIIFNATKWHKVTNVRPVAGNMAGIRYAFAVNANRQKPKRLSSGKQKSKW
eukprot:1004732_1